MNTRNEEIEYVERQPSRAKSLLTGLFVGGLVGAGTVLLLAPQSGSETRAEVRSGAIHLRDRTSETVKGKVEQARSKANQIKTDVQVKAEDLQHQGMEYDKIFWYDLIYMSKVLQRSQMGGGKTR